MGVKIQMHRQRFIKLGMLTLPIYTHHLAFIRWWIPLYQQCKDTKCVYCVCALCACVFVCVCRRPSQRLMWCSELKQSHTSPAALPETEACWFTYCLKVSRSMQVWLLENIDSISSLMVVGIQNYCIINTSFNQLLYKEIMWI